MYCVNNEAISYIYVAIGNGSNLAGENVEIILLIKQVPETSNVKIDEADGTMIREGVESIVNPLDLYSIEVGIQLKEKFGGKVTVLSLGPPGAEKAIREAISMGCDEGILITGKAFSGSDTWATAFALSEAVKKTGSFDLILAGERATDGDTGQVGPGVASFLDIPLGTYISKISRVTRKDIVVERLVETGYEMLQLPLPALLTVVKEVSFPRLPTLRGKQRAKSMTVPHWSPEEITPDSSKLGLRGSPTRVVKISHPKVTRNGTVLRAGNGTTPAEAVDQLVNFLREKGIIQEGKV